MLVALPLAGCGSHVSSVNKAAGVSEAGSGCHLLLGVGQAMEEQKPTSGSAIDQQLRRAENEIRSAAIHDSHWKTLSTETDAFVATLERGQTPGQDQIVELTNGCEQFAITSAPNTT